ncbi:MAG: cytochrome c [Saprospiraceae bacterium]|nr:cytochrome c [Saprospiraceae bacterium]
MRKSLIVIAIFSLIWACGSTTDSENDTAIAQTAEAEDGAKIYKQYCIACHGLYGNMGASGAFDLSKSILTEEQRIEVITNGRNTMVGFKTLLSEEKIKAVAKHTFSFKK